MKNLGKTILIAIISLGIFSAAVQAKPMDIPTLQEAIKSQQIVIAEYEGYESDGEVDYFQGIKTNYRVLKILKGNKVNANIMVRYAFQDGSACEEPEKWCFSEELMPSKGSKWILFLEKKTNDQYYTYRGDYGRWEASKSNIQKVIWNILISCDRS